MSLSRPRTQTARSGDERTNHEASAPPTIIAKAALVIYSMSKHRAFESLLTQHYSSIILAIKCIGISIFRTDNGCYKIFDLHANMVEAIPQVHVNY